MANPNNKSFIYFSLALAAASGLYSAWREYRKRRAGTESRFRQAFGEPQTLPDGTQIVRCRMSYEELENILHPEKAQEKPPLPEDVDVFSLPKYWGGCPHGGKMSIVGEHLWRYQELSRTRGYMNNTTTYVCRCRNCRGLMQATVDHDD